MLQLLASKLGSIVSYTLSAHGVDGNDMGALANGSIHETLEGTEFGCATSMLSRFPYWVSHTDAIYRP
jgi:hypothetical protein